MVGIAFDFRRTAFVAFHQQADRVRAKRHGRGIKLRLAESQSIGLLNVRHNILLWRAPTAGKGPQKPATRPSTSGNRAGRRRRPIPKAPAAEIRGATILQIGITGEFLERSPVLLSGFRLELGAHRGQIHGVFVQLRLSSRSS